jgi:hypothetical protein
MKNTSHYSWFQTFAVFWMLYAFFWVIQTLGNYPEVSIQHVIMFIVMLLHAWSQINMKVGKTSGSTGTNYHSVFPKPNHRRNILHTTTCVTKAPLKCYIIKQILKLAVNFWSMGWRMDVAFGTRHLMMMIILDRSNKWKTGWLKWHQSEWEQPTCQLIHQKSCKV